MPWTKPSLNLNCDKSTNNKPFLISSFTLVHAGNSISNVTHDRSEYEDTQQEGYTSQNKLQGGVRLVRASYCCQGEERPVETVYVLPESDGVWRLGQEENEIWIELLKSHAI